MGNALKHTMLTPLMSAQGFNEVVQVAMVVSDIQSAVKLWASVLKVKEPEIVETEEWEKSSASLWLRATRLHCSFSFPVPRFGSADSQP